MKNFKLLGIIALAAVISFAMLACDDGGGGSGTKTDTRVALTAGADKEVNHDVTETTVTFTAPAGTASTALTGLAKADFTAASGATIETVSVSGTTITLSVEFEENDGANAVFYEIGIASSSKIVKAGTGKASVNITQLDSQHKARITLNGQANAKQVLAEDYSAEVTFTAESGLNGIDTDEVALVEEFYITGAGETGEVYSVTIDSDTALTVTVYFDANESEAADNTYKVGVKSNSTIFIAGTEVTITHLKVGGEIEYGIADVSATFPGNTQIVSISDHLSVVEAPDTGAAFSWDNSGRGVDFARWNDFYTLGSSVDLSDYDYFTFDFAADKSGVFDTLQEIFPRFVASDDSWVEFGNKLLNIDLSTSIGDMRGSFVQPLMNGGYDTKAWEGNWPNGRWITVKIPISVGAQMGFATPNPSTGSRDDVLADVVQFSLQLRHRGTASLAENTSNTGNYYVRNFGFEKLPTPNIVSATPASVGPNATSASVTFTAERPVTGITAADFSVTTGGNIGAVTINGAVITVPVTFAANAEATAKTYVVSINPTSTKITGTTTATITQAMVGDTTADLEGDANVNVGAKAITATATFTAVSAEGLEELGAGDFAVDNGATITGVTATGTTVSVALSIPANTNLRAGKTYTVSIDQDTDKILQNGAEAKVVQAAETFAASPAVPKGDPSYLTVEKYSYNDDSDGNDILELGITEGPDGEYWYYYMKNAVSSLREIRFDFNPPIDAVEEDFDYFVFDVMGDSRTVLNSTWNTYPRFINTDDQFVQFGDYGEITGAFGHDKLPNNFDADNTVITLRLPITSNAPGFAIHAGGTNYDDVMEDIKAFVPRFSIRDEFVDPNHRDYNVANDINISGDKIYLKNFRFEKAEAVPEVPTLFPNGIKVTHTDSDTVTIVEYASGQYAYSWENIREEDFKVWEVWYWMSGGIDISEKQYFTFEIAADKFAILNVLQDMNGPRLRKGGGGEWCNFAQNVQDKDNPATHGAIRGSVIDKIGGSGAYDGLGWDDPGKWITVKVRILQTDANENQGQYNAMKDGVNNFNLRLRYQGTDTTAVTADNTGRFYVRNFGFE